MKISVSNWEKFDVKVFFHGCHGESGYLRSIDKPF